ncbi:DUF1835 domain-containing protein [Shivajiella indica]|uniref:DUF1835 domain-containing protein n=1 Tax=Shivajiella indica TaxID=872115 RepID=A0ABW5B4U6_9BACT
METYHVLNGDCLTGQLKEIRIDQNFIVCRECLMEGDLAADNLSDFFKIRAKFIKETFNTSEDFYYSKTAGEFEKLVAIPDDSKVCLWFGNDLFCQVNMWFVISLFADRSNIQVYRIFPANIDSYGTCKGFAVSNAEMLEQSYASREIFRPEDMELGKNLWTAFKHGDFIKLKELSKVSSNCFQHLDKVCQAHMDRFPKDNSLGRPEKIVKEILETKSTNFQDVFMEFSNREGIYGLGDLQLKVIYDKEIKNLQK